MSGYLWSDLEKEEDPGGSDEQKDDLSELPSGNDSPLRQAYIYD